MSNAVPVDRLDSPLDALAHHWGAIADSQHFGNSGGAKRFRLLPLGPDTPHPPSSLTEVVLKILQDHPYVKGAGASERPLASRDAKLIERALNDALDTLFIGKAPKRLAPEIQLALRALKRELTLLAQSREKSGGLRVFLGNAYGDHKFRQNSVTLIDTQNACALMLYEGRSAEI